MYEVAFAVAMLLSSCCEKADIADYFANIADVSVSEQVEETPLAESILEAAKQMVELKTRYRFSFPNIEYPYGDIARDWGLCCDIIVRACRAGGIDLQQLVYEDSLVERNRYIQANRYHRFSRPLNRSWIHRRTSNLNLFLERFAQSLPREFDPASPEDWQPGDIVVYRKNGRVTWHVALVSDQWDVQRGIPQIIDAWLKPGYVSEEHLLTDHGPIAGHYRLTDEFRDSLSLDHRRAALASWKSFIGSEFEAVGSNESRVSSTPSNPSAGWLTR